MAPLTANEFVEQISNLLDLLPAYDTALARSANTFPPHTGAAWDDLTEISRRISLRSSVILHQNAPRECSTTSAFVAQSVRLTSILTPILTPVLTPILTPILTAILTAILTRY